MWLSCFYLLSNNTVNCYKLLSPLDLGISPHTAHYFY